MKEQHLIKGWEMDKRAAQSQNGKLELKAYYYSEDKEQKKKRKVK